MPLLTMLIILSIQILLIFYVDKLHTKRIVSTLEAQTYIIIITVLAIVSHLFINTL